MKELLIDNSRSVDIEISQPLPRLLLAGEPSPSRTIPVLARLHGHPIGALTVTVTPAGIDAAELATAVWAATPAAGDHLRDDGLDVPETLGGQGLPAPAGTVCEADRRRHEILRNPPTITVMIASRERDDSLRRCLAAIARLDYPKFDVVVVDNAPRGDTSARVVAGLHGRCGPANLGYVREFRPGLARAHNRGLQAVTGDWVAITDDDVVVDPNWLTAIAEATTRTPTVACVTGPILPAELDTPAQILIEQAGGFNRGFTTRLYDTGANRPADVLFPLTTGRLGSGANMAFDTRVLTALGGFDHLLGAGTQARGGDDLSGFLNILAAGHTLAYQPAAIVHHFHPRGYDRLQQQSFNYGIGLGAYLTSAALHHPQLMPQMVRRAAPGLTHFTSRSSTKNAGKRPDFPAELDRAERRGLLLGPFAYAVSFLDHLRGQGRAAGGTRYGATLGKDAASVPTIAELDAERRAADKQSDSADAKRMHGWRTVWAAQRRRPVREESRRP